MITIGLDFETFFSKDYNFRKLHTLEYVRDDRFKIHGCSIRIGSEETKWHSGAGLEDTLQSIDWSDVILVCHNTYFDGLILHEHFGVHPAAYRCTLSMGRALFPFLDHDLDSLGRTLGVGGKVQGTLEETKGIKTLSPELEAKLATYAVQDTDVMMGAYDIMVVAFPQDELDLLDLTLRWGCIPTLWVDIPRAKVALEGTVSSQNATIEASGVDRKVLSSNQQFASHLYTLGITPPTKLSPTTHKLTYALAKGDLEFLDMIADHPEHKHLWDARLAAKSNLLRTRTQRVINIGTGGACIPMPLKYCGAHTLRWSGQDGLNPQNFPRGSELRKSLIAPKGHHIVVADLSQIELRLNFWFCGQLDLLEVFRSGRDIYKDTASAHYGVPYEEVTEDQRFFAKQCVAKGELVLTDKGLVPIEEITLAHRLWDGIEWVNHEGLIDQGMQEVITYDGLTATKDHPVITEQGRAVLFREAASKMDRLLRSGAKENKIWVNNSSIEPHPEAEGLQVCARGMCGVKDKEVGITRQPKIWENHFVSGERSEDDTQCSSAGETLRRSEVTLPKQAKSCLQKLWWAWHRIKIQITDALHYLDEQTLTTQRLCWAGDRSHRQQRALRTGKPMSCYSYRAKQEQKELCENYLAREINSYTEFSKPILRILDLETSKSLWANRGTNTAKVRVYDIANAGPRHRFTVSGVLIFNCDLGLGYGMGAPRFRREMALKSLPLTTQEALNTVNHYRYEHSYVQRMWNALDEMVYHMFNGTEQEIKCVGFREKAILLPNNMTLDYSGLTPHENNQWTYGGKSQKKLYGALLLENIIQALARVVLGEMMLKTHKDHPWIQIVSSTHDEIIAIAPESRADEALEEMLSIMGLSPLWAPDLPLRGEGAHERFYCK